MCQNLAWQLCAAKGLLPGQGGKLLHFATAPKDLDIAEWEHPSIASAGIRPAAAGVPRSAHTKLPPTDAVPNHSLPLRTTSYRSLPLVVASWPCQRGCPAGKYSVGDVFFAEVAVFRRWGLPREPVMGAVCCCAQTVCCRTIRRVPAPLI